MNKKVFFKELEDPFSLKKVFPEIYASILKDKNIKYIY